MNRTSNQNDAAMGDDLMFGLSSKLPIERFAGVKLVLAVSGGADSVAMLHLIHGVWSQTLELSPRLLTVAHFNHGLRGNESDGDEAFVQQLSQSLGLEFISQRTTSGPNSKDEESLRSARYRFLQQSAERLGARYVLVAHHRDDNVETFLHHLFRGSGIAGLAGMRRHRPLGSDVVLYRPLLDLPQTKLRQWLVDRSLGWREDRSNQVTTYQRNWMRHSLLPHVIQRYPNAVDAIERAIEQQSATLHTLQVLADRWIEANVQRDRSAMVIRRSPLDISLIGLVVRQLWDQQSWRRQPLTQTHLHQLWQAIQPTDQRAEPFQLPGRIHVRSTRDGMLVIGEVGPTQA